MRSFADWMKSLSPRISQSVDIPLYATCLKVSLPLVVLCYGSRKEQEQKPRRSIRQSVLPALMKRRSFRISCRIRRRTKERKKTTKRSLKQSVSLKERKRERRRRKREKENNVKRRSLCFSFSEEGIPFPSIACIHSQSVVCLDLPST